VREGLQAKQIPGRALCHLKGLESGERPGHPGMNNWNPVANPGRQHQCQMDATSSHPEHIRSRPDLSNKRKEILEGRTPLG
jgi:hypothetical protein